MATPNLPPRIPRLPVILKYSVRKLNHKIHQIYHPVTHSLTVGIVISTLGSVGWMLVIFLWGFPFPEFRKQCHSTSLLQLFSLSFHDFCLTIMLAL